MGKPTSKTVLVLLLLSLFTITMSGETRGGNANGARCRFPFVYMDKQYDVCISIDSDDPWCSTTGNYDRNRKWGLCQEDDLRNLPRFINETPNNVSTYVNNKAQLICSVENLGRKQVQWSRRDSYISNNEPELLFVGHFKATKDSRLSIRTVRMCGETVCAPHDRPPSNSRGESVLTITRSKLEDIAIYRCQVITHSPIFRDIQFSVIDRLPSDTQVLTIDGNRDRVVTKGDPLFIQCRVPRMPQDSDGPSKTWPTVQWFKDGYPVEGLEEKGMVFQRQNKYETTMMTSSLQLVKADMEASGDYVCKDERQQTAKISVLVLDVDKDNTKRDMAVNRPAEAKQGVLQKAPNGATPLSSQSIPRLLSLVCLMHWLEYRAFWIQLEII